jgi:hypothetical protein
MTKYLRQAALVLALGLLSACNGDNSTPTEPGAGPFTSSSTNAPLTQAFELRPGETFTLDAPPAEVTFVRVLSDTRCSIEAVCPDLGGTDVEIQVRQPSGTSTHVVRYEHGPTDAQATVVGPWAFTADMVSPAMRSSQVIQPNEYQVTFIATRR